MIEVLRQMVKVLEANRPINYCENGKGERFPMFENNPFRQEANEQAIQAGKQAIAKLENQEPVGYQFQSREGLWREFIDQRHYELTVTDGTWPIRAIYTHLPQRTWVGLTEQQRNAIEDACEMIIGEIVFYAIERQLEKNNT
jgi:hypothetical protein